eukprot:CAMPEP_0197033654 /NCGR_PEP_ID=MMETSP1384-20130603/12005_1 /TAXON_ID=29189 /ORGANISM="Ammonia sp." /LENGTH=447 /DNA_ID=CAMNT_0042463495 /DNA_START=26 /DNA_END=1366 /DNA_ORIENTATION=+
MFALLLLSLTAVAFAQNPPLNTLTLPPGFNIEVFANKSWHVRTPRELNVQFYEGATIIYLGTLNTNFKNPIALVDRDSDNKIDASFVLFDAPANINHIDSLAVHPETGQLFFSGFNQTWKCEGNVNELVLNEFNESSRLTCNRWFTCPYNASQAEWHAFHFMDFNLNTKQLCMSFGQPCNECIDKANTPPKSTIMCYDTDTAQHILDGTVWAAGVRNSFGHKFHPKTGKMWFTDNGRDELLSTTNMPDDELNVVNEVGEFFGYPYCHSEGCGDPYQRDVECVSAITDPDLGDGGFTNNCTSNVTLAKQALGPHVGVLGMRFYTGSMFPAKYSNAIFAAEHGSWDRTPLIGYRVGVVFLDDAGQNVVGNDIFIAGWLNDSTQSVWGRVTDLDWLKDGSMILCDDQQQVIYRVWYNVSEDTPQAQQEYQVKKQELQQAYDAAYSRAMMN